MFCSAGIHLAEGVGSGSSCGEHRMEVAKSRAKGSHPGGASPTGVRENQTVDSLYKGLCDGALGYINLTKLCVA